MDMGLFFEGYDAADLDAVMVAQSRSSVRLFVTP